MGIFLREPLTAKIQTLFMLKFETLTRKRLKLKLYLFINLFMQFLYSGPYDVFQ